MKNVGVSDHFKITFNYLNPFIFIFQWIFYSSRLAQKVQNWHYLRRGMLVTWTLKFKISDSLNSNTCFCLWLYGSLAFFHSGVRIKPNTSFQTLPLANAQTCIGEEGSAPDYRQTGVATSGFTTYTLPIAEILSGKNAWAFVVCGLLMKSFKKNILKI